MKKWIVAGLLVSALAAGAATFEWDPSPANEKVTAYWFEHRLTTETNWTRVEVTNGVTRVTIPQTTAKRLFRIAAVNNIGPSDFTEPVMLPSNVIGLRIVLTATP